MAMDVQAMVIKRCELFNHISTIFAYLYGAIHLFCYIDMQLLLLLLFIFLTLCIEGGESSSSSSSSTDKNKNRNGKRSKSSTNKQSQADAGSDPLFRSCDVDRDSRLSLIELGDCLRGLAGGEGGMDMSPDALFGLLDSNKVCIFSYNIIYSLHNYLSE